MTFVLQSPLATTQGTRTGSGDEATQTGLSYNRTEAEFGLSDDPALAEASSRPAPPVTEPPEAAASSTAFNGTVHNVASVADWNRAVAAVQPGDQIRLTANINANLKYRGRQGGRESPNAADGTAEAPILITAAADVWIDPGNTRNRQPGLDVMNTAHVHVVGIRVRNSQFGIRVQNSNGSADAPMRIADNTVSDIGHAGIHIAGHLVTHEPSQYVEVAGNYVTRTGLTADEFGEGIYLGYGSREWVDLSSNIRVANNQVTATTAEGIDIKPGTRNVLVENNMIHDISPIRGGAISAHYVGSTANPNASQSSNVVIRNNRIWNINLNNKGGSNDWAIWVGHGGITIDSNYIWGMRNSSGEVRAVRVRGLQSFGPHPIVITNNVFWTATGWVAEGSPSGAALVQSSNNSGPSGSSGVEQTISPDEAVPAVGSGGGADGGSGPGSALGYEPARTTTMEWLTGEPSL
ncbi:MAG: right-handed parallel beta-helix repeat-containing protein [Actinomycetota bacterium]